MSSFAVFSMEAANTKLYSVYLNVLKYEHKTEALFWTVLIIQNQLTQFWFRIQLFLDFQEQVCYEWVKS